MPEYSPESVPFGDGSSQELREYIWRELLRISGTMGKSPFILLEEISLVPGKVQDGTVLWADGVNFDPGDGPGFYGRRGMAWYKLDNVGTASFDELTADHINVNHVQFPAVQVPSADVNALDDAQRGTWTPAMTFATPGNLSIVNTTQEGTYLKIGRSVFARLRLVCTPTHTTASGNWTLTGLPFIATNTPVFSAGGGSLSNIGAGFTWPVGVTMVSLNVVPNTTTAILSGAGSAIAQANFTNANVTSGAVLTLVASIVYEAAV